jgi:hypothetical protein
MYDFTLMVICRIFSNSNGNICNIHKNSMHDYVSEDSEEGNLVENTAEIPTSLETEHSVVGTSVILLQ